MQRFDLPIPHTVIDGFIDVETVRKINAEWPDDWQVENGSFQVKWNTTTLTNTAKDVVDSIDVGLIERLTGVDGLFLDPELFGAGLHCIPHGGFLNMHVDFNQHPEGWHRRANCLIYLNEVWDDSWGGHLILGENREKAIAPIGGRCVIFETTEDSWHGHPEPLSCPKHMQRRSLAMYFYTKNPPKAEPHSTVYKKK